MSLLDAPYGVPFTYASSTGDSPEVWIKVKTWPEGKPFGVVSLTSAENYPEYIYPGGSRCLVITYPNAVLDLGQAGPE